MSHVQKIAQEVVEGFKITSATQEVEITAMAWQDVVSMQKAMLKSNPTLVFDVVSTGKSKHMIIYKAAKVASSNVVFVDFKNKSIVSVGKEERRK